MDGSGLEGGCMSEHLAWGRGGEFMLPGTDCLDCHRVDGDAESVFSIAGTITTSPLCPDPVEGAIVHVLDDAGVAVELVSNEEGNFFTTEALVPPFIVSVERDGHVLPMEFPASHGSCGGCHAEGSPLGFVWALQ